jgi:hypothetical protein
MAANLPQRDTKARVSPASNVAKSRHGTGLSKGAISPEGLPTLAPWHKLGWGLFLPLVFASNVIVATLVWSIVGLIMR